MDFVYLVEKLKSKVDAVYRGNLKMSRDPKKGYQATFDNFVAETTTTEDELSVGPISVRDSGDSGSYSERLGIVRQFPRLIVLGVLVQR